MKNKKYSKGFTLVELLVVIAIIGILAAVVLVSLSSQRAKANESSAVQSIKSGIPYAMDCVLRGVAVPVPAEGAAICPGAPSWATAADLAGDCDLAGTANPANGTGGTATISGCGTGRTITCTYETSACVSN
ncbi:MAG: type II secretion system protein [Parcubacteria group bacterium]|jgi:prepilin-type N-terminal cleavage/methylation domain-containing protein